MDHISKAQAAGLRAVARTLRKDGVIPAVTAKSATPKLKWADATADQKLEYLMREMQGIKDSQWPPNQFANDTPLDDVIREKEGRQVDQRLDKADKRMKAMEERVGATDDLIKKLTAHINDVIAPAIDKLSKEQK